MVDIPLGLKNAIETQNCVLFVGAGIGCHYVTPEGVCAPTGTGLCELICAKFGVTFRDGLQLAKIAELVEIRHQRSELEAYVSSVLGNLTPDETFRWITTVRWKAIYTTNYDGAIERAFSLCNRPLQTPVVYSITSDLRSHRPVIEVPVYHIHGLFSAEGDPNIIITMQDYARFRQKRRMLFEQLKLEMVSSSFLYIGYSNTDPNWETLTAEMREDFHPSTPPTSYRVDPYTDEIDVEILKSRGIHTIRCSFEDFVNSAAIFVAQADPTENILGAGRRNIPPDLLPSFDKAPIPVTRLLASWRYLNQADLSEAPNLTAFLKGDMANWSLIEKKLFFERDIQGDLYDSILDFATTNKQTPAVSIVLGSAGYGTSTLLMALAVEVVREEIGGVFVLKTGMHVLEGDIEFAASLFPNVFFVIDDAADQAVELERVIHRLKEARCRSFFLMGERLNEWHQSARRPQGKEFQIESLSDSEIDRLLDFLSENGALSNQSLPRDLLFAAVKQRYQKELLVVMREIIEDNNFDAIIESEFRGLGDPISQRLYLYVCSFYQHGALVRDTLLSEAIGKTIVELYQHIQHTTEGVVVIECIDEERGLYAARARHHKIAEVVWERCADPEQKDDVVKTVMKRLNLNFGTDARAFEHFVRSDRVVDCIRSVEDRISFFETATQKDPTSPYVRQHYARMLSRAGMAQLALSQIEAAIRQAPGVRVLYHTKGKILSELSLRAESIEIGRRYMIQAEGSFVRGTANNERDEYNFEGLASLYFEWSRKLSGADEAEATTYLSKSEETISRGLRSVRNKESLWVLSSKIQAYLGDTPRSIEALEAAIRDHPGAIVARYLLGRAYRLGGRPMDALTVLDPVVKSDSDEFRALSEYALALLDLGEPFGKAATVLRLGTLFGLGDPRFTSTYGGILFLAGEFSEAQQVFERSKDRSLPANELYQVYFRPRDTGNRSEPFTLAGEVVTVRPGSSLIQVAGYPHFTCQSSKYKGTLMKRGLRVRFEVGFCAEGPVALSPRPTPG